MAGGGHLLEGTVAGGHCLEGTSSGGCCLEDGLSVIGQAIARIRESVAYCSGSPKREQKFVEAARQEGIESTKKLALDCETRWNSTYLMLETAFIYKDVFFRLKLREPQYRCLPTEEEWELAEQVCSKLKIFYVATNLFSGTKYLTSNNYFPKICEIRIALSNWLRCGNDLIRNMATKMLEKFNKYWDVIHGILGVASLLDPRYKMKSLDYFFPRIYGVDGKYHIMRIQGLLSDLFNQYQSKQGSSQPPPNATPSFQANIPCSEDDGSVSDFDMYIAQESNVVEGKSELDFYLEEKLLPGTPNFDILVWWKATGPKYPILSSIARDILAIPVSTVASESIFSTGGKKCGLTRLELAKLKETTT
ncbi:zinc finger BED domain-containing protein RICESLEEPER 1-like [Pistacia vera]|uniref:zinc finger BED domain-containing protein RICESLEEPER 1-like n=1 Tax=Pistacia vera TaxID=55513 RepID=UPI001263D15C|nr:zinc finger BED domain-containing protein RICESLEEPER 1-like [Pistacia vera]